MPSTSQIEQTVHSSALASALGRRAGAAVALLRGDGIEVITAGRCIGRDTPVQVASVTKAFTGLLLADAVLRGEATMDSRLDEVLFGERWGAPSMAALATHTSGLPRLSLGARILLPSPYRSYTREHLLHWLAGRKPRQPQAAAYAYSNLAFAVLGLMLEKVTGRRYAELMQERVFDPLRMRHSSLLLSESGAVVKRGYGRLGLTPPWLLPRPPLWRFDAYAPCGAVVSTLDDLLAAARALLEPTHPLADAFALARQARAEGPGCKVGLAWHRSADGRFVWHNGSTFGHSAYLAIAPESGVAVAAVCNKAVAAPLTLLGHTLMRAALS